MLTRTDVTRGEKVCQFITKYCRTPEGKGVGKPMHLLEFQEKFILDIYDNPAGTSRAYLSIARKNGKSSLIASLVLAHLVGPEAKQNSQIISGARSRDQASVIFKLAQKMVALSPELRKIVKIIPSQKILIGLPMNVEYRAISAEAATAHGLSPIVAILDEVGQVKGAKDPFVEAIETAQGAYDAPLLLAISTQAAEDSDLFSIWLDDAAHAVDPQIVCHVHSAPESCALDDKSAWLVANPAMGEFRSIDDIEQFAARAERMPSSENTFRWLYLNQRVNAASPFISKSQWQLCAGPVKPIDDVPVYGGLDLSETTDLTALVLVGKVGDVWQVHPTFWLPGDGIVERSRKDRVPYDLWTKQGHIIGAPGKSVDFEYVAAHLREVCNKFDIQKIEFDRWKFNTLKPWLLRAGFTEKEITEKFSEFGQGFRSMGPALLVLEAEIANARIAHGGHPVMTMCARNAVVQVDPAGSKKLAKNKSTGRIDGMVALAMAMGAPSGETERKREYQMLFV